MTNEKQFGGISGEQLRGYIERIEKLEEEKADIATAIREVYSEAKGNGFDAKVMRVMVKRRKMDAHERDEQDAIIDIYSHALGMLPLMEYGQKTKESAA